MTQEQLDIISKDLVKTIKLLKGKVKRSTLIDSLNRENI